ncbi:MAG: hypothetical protein LUG99_10155 [Lachnospiraceae bacterium]|nr:hypothetical protein [Lachnospiraceae bacterium]
MADRIRLAGYVKLAKLWERNADQAISYHRGYYERKYADDGRVAVVGVYIDITGQKLIPKRPEMVRLLKDCTLGKINCIEAQTKGYFAANTQELCFLLKYIFDLPYQIDLLTEDKEYHIDTIRNEDGQKQALKKMADDYVGLYSDDYMKWKKRLLLEMEK